MKREAFRLCKILNKVQSQYGVTARIGHHERESTTNGNKNPKEGRPKGLRRGGKIA